MSAEKLAAIADLKTLLNSGALSTTVDGETTTFRSQAELRQRINELEREAGLRQRRRGSYTVYMGGR